MSNRVPGPRISLPALLFLAACSDPLYEEAPDLTGVYQMASWTSVDWTDSVTATPPSVEGMMEILQLEATGPEATGEVSGTLRINREDGFRLGEFDGSYVIDSEGNMRLYRLTGRFTFEDGILTTNLQSDASTPYVEPRGRIVWEPCPACVMR